MLWFALDMDEGVRGVFPTKREAVEKMVDGGKHQTYRYGPGSYEVRDYWDDDSPSSFFLMKEELLEFDGWDWAHKAWVEAGKPIGRFSAPIPGQVPH